MSTLSINVVRVALIGCVESTEAVLRTILAGGKNVSCAGLVTRRVSRFNTDFVDLLPLAEAAVIPVMIADECASDEELAAWLRGIAPDVTMVVGWSKLIKKEVLTIPPLGTIGYHPAALPANRGRHPIVWALALGLSETASSFFFMGEGTDDGPLLSQQVVPITLEDDARTLYDKLLAVIPMQIEEILARLFSGSLEGTPQNHRLANSWRKRSPADGCIDWRMSAQSIHNLVRALTRPYPGAHLIFENQEIKVWKCQVEAISTRNIEPGKVLEVDGRTLLVKAGDNAVRLVNADFPVMPSVGDYL